ncbi:hypothetical protein Calag_0638 [Caldisphaera lagunensis DSM 15908]|uniref:Uncharacterized protein n=1 Tax=Caldisphaera lagunensis (strain DSM 15908 / JCM 11604 / ANMR 0165 / IC-154) TaxID=1056495 RepID=L0A925_CALLD|nr:hypothetical protein [Caldisphaera lagunensis]AFZ70393.1 hypothetical protein Calag_0638 [Caldisphaera lagunensis DSM 15908]
MKKMRAHDALRKTFLKFNVQADPYTLMELESFVIISRNKDKNNKNYQSLVSNLELVLTRQEIDNAKDISKKMADFILDLCKDGCE